ncbi:hypothetical protein GGI07_001771 [Coemansia sp. Benny D115]|nr:hypothetical protein GGI07_001771 [Coemansia sp. Benny D115]
MSAVVQRAAAAIVAENGIKSTEDLTRTLKAPGLALEKKLLLAQGVFDSSSSNREGSQGTLKRLGDTLVRKNELLVEWLFSTMLQELKPGKKGKAKDTTCVLTREADAYDLLARILKDITAGSGKLELRSVLAGPVLSLFLGAFSVEQPSRALVDAVARLWLAVVDERSDGAEVFATQIEQLGQLLCLAATSYLSTSDEQIGESLCLMVQSIATVLRGACEATHNSRRTIALFDEKLLPLVLRLISKLSGDAQAAVVDMLHAGLYHSDNLVRFVLVLAPESSQKNNPVGELQLAENCLKLLKECVTTSDLELRMQYMEAIPQVLARFLQAQALLCTETRGRASTTVGIVSMAASPVTISSADAGTTCFEFFSRLYHDLASQVSQDSRILATVNRLVHVYFSDPCFGATGGAASVGDMHKKQETMLEAWLVRIVMPALDIRRTVARRTFAMDAARLALDVTPDTVRILGSKLFDSLTSVPVEAVRAGAELLTHMVSILARARLLDTLFEMCSRAEVSAGADADCVNMLASADFQNELRRAVPLAMPFVQARATLEMLADALIGIDSVSHKKRRLDSGGRHASGDCDGSRSELLAVTTANLALAAVATASTEHQRTQLAETLEAKHALFEQTLGSKDAPWERLLLHYVFVEAAARLGCMEPWVALAMNPVRVKPQVLACANGSTPRVAVLAMLVAFQTAAHWAASVAAIRAGVESTSMDSTELGLCTKAVEEMISAVLQLDALLSTGWGSWDGQPQTISAQNAGRAQWQLLTGRLELACEFAGSASLEAIAKCIAAETVAGNHELFLDAGFFEIVCLRRLLAPAMALKASEMWLECSGSRESALDQLARDFSSGSATAIVKSVVAERGSSVQLADKNSTQWLNLLKALLRVPEIYWLTEQQSAIFALVLVIDTRVAVAFSPDVSSTVRVLARTLLARLISYHSPLAVLFQPNKFDWATGESSESFAAASRRLLRLTTSALAQDAFLRGNVEASKSCLELCTQMYECLSVLGIQGSGVLALEAFSAVAAVMRTGGRKKSVKQSMEKTSNDKWISVVKEWTKQMSQRALDAMKTIVESAADDSNMAIDAKDEQDALCLGLFICLDTTLSSLTEKPGMTKYAKSLVSFAIDSLDIIAKHESNLVLGLVLLITHRSTEKDITVANRLLAFLARKILASVSTSETRVCLVQQALAACVPTATVDNATFDRIEFFSVHFIEPLLRSLSPELFESTLNSIILSTSNAAPKLLRAYINTGYRSFGGQPAAVEKRKSVQRRLGSILSALHTGLHTGMQPSWVLDVVSALVREPSMRFTMHDVTECLAIATTIAMLPTSPHDPSQLYKDLCRLLSSIIGYHTNQVLDSISILVNVLRMLVHAFVLPAIPRVLLSSKHQESSVQLTPWVISMAPLSTECAESYSRVLNDLGRSRRSANTNSMPTENTVSGGSDLVKLTRGTNAAGASSVLSLFAPNILAEYCIIQGGGAMSTVVSKGSQKITGSDSYLFKGLTWRPSLVVQDSGDDGIPISTGNNNTARGTIASPAIREALLPGWHALLDIMTVDDRNCLLSLLAASSTTDARSYAMANYGGTSIFGPDRHAGAHEVLKSLYQSYVDFYKFKGEV